MIRHRVPNARADTSGAWASTGRTLVEIGHTAKRADRVEGEGQSADRHALLPASGSDGGWRTLCGKPAVRDYKGFARAVTCRRCAARVADGVGITTRR